MAVRARGLHLYLGFIAYALFVTPNLRAQTPSSVQPAPDSLVRIMAVWGDGSIRPETPLRPANALLVSSSAQSALLLTNASSIRGARSILVMENVLLPEQASMRATVVTTEESLDLAILAAPPLNARPVATLNVAPLSAAQRYSILAFLHQKGVPLESIPKVTGPVIQAASHGAPSGPPVVDVAHGNVGAEGALIDDCGYVVGWHVPAYAFPSAQLVNGVGVSAGRIVAWLAQTGINARTTDVCSNPGAATSPALPPAALTLAVTPGQTTPGDVPVAPPAGPTIDAATAAPEPAAVADNTPARPKAPIIIAAVAGLGIALLVAGLLYFRKDSNMAPPKRPRVSNLLQRASDAGQPAVTMSWKFQGKLSNGKRLRFTLKASDVVKRTNGLVVGRDRKSAKLHIEDESLSRIHAKFFFVNGELRIEDCGSENGTTINGRKLSANRPEKISAGDTIGLGGVQLKIA